MSRLVSASNAASWSPELSESIYRLRKWGDGYFRISEKGDVSVSLADVETGKEKEFSLASMVASLGLEGIRTPVLLRFPSLLHSRLEKIQSGFEGAISKSGYQNRYQGVFPIKVNQRAEVVEEIAKASATHYYGLEVGSRTELTVALAHLEDPNSFLVCNGYKDEAYIRLALSGTKLGLRVVIVVEMPGELETILRVAEEMGVDAVLGVRLRLGLESTGRWGGTNGDKGLFGLNPSQILELLDRLREADALGWLQMLHYHQGSQIAGLSGVCAAAKEAARVYGELKKEGAAMKYLNTGGGLAVDYDGSQTVSNNSMNYEIEDYCAAVVESVKSILDRDEIEHPLLLSECGRGLAAHYSVLVFDVLDVARFDARQVPDKLPLDSASLLLEMEEVVRQLDSDNARDSIATLSTLRKNARQLFAEGDMSLRECGLADRIFYLAQQRANGAAVENHANAGLLPTLGQSDFLYGNFSVFQSLPDHWALGQFFPVIPLHRLNEQPMRQGVIADLTCDSDGKIKTYIHPKDESEFLPVHELKPGETYLMGAFLVGAYQETLGDMHNLFGLTHVASVENKGGNMHLARIMPGDSTDEVLAYLEYDIGKLRDKFKALTNTAVENGEVTEKEGAEMNAAYDQTLKGYTYLGSP
ncbi:MAG: biosynthetic arginine decarboxylase [Verrucomicrobiota bacterium]